MKDRLLEHWDINYLVSFLYIFLAESDFVINKEEAIALNDSLHNTLVRVFFQTEEQKDAIIKEVNAYTHTLTETQKMELVETLAKKIDIPFDVYELIVQELNKIAKSDKYVSVEEHSLLFYIRLKLNKDYDDN
ncbi:hypothetical protein [uncultured Cytophaga sp.]|uniref:hypothetical protein n=1 Tax=uncultured Cytophaga sp. TaxID=160238 RepID=UPI00262793B8|nr:hypothetical protein [uncultured Cytophaga sp.]